MSQNILTPPPDETIIYPDSDGKPMADNTLQYRWIVTIEGGLDAMYADDPDVFVAGDLLWYPVKGRRDICQAPDALVAFGRPKGYRGSYKQWEEGDLPPRVVFEILSPGNTRPEMDRKFDFYERYGVEEYYIYDPDRIKLFGWVRQGDRLDAIPQMIGWTSPLLGIRFEIADELQVFGPDGRRFLSYVELSAERDAVMRQKDAAERLAAELAEKTARLREKLKSLGLDPDA